MYIQHDSMSMVKECSVSLGILPDFMDTFASVTGLYHHHCFQDFEMKLNVLDGCEDLTYVHLFPQITRVKVRKAVLTFSTFSHTFNMTFR